MHHNEAVYSWTEEKSSLYPDKSEGDLPGVGAVQRYSDGPLIFRSLLSAENHAMRGGSVSRKGRDVRRLPGAVVVVVHWTAVRRMGTEDSLCEGEVPPAAWLRL